MPDLIVHIPDYIGRTPERAAEWLRRRLPIGTGRHPDPVGTCAEREAAEA